MMQYHGNPLLPTVRAPEHIPLWRWLQNEQGESPLCNVEQN